MRAPVGLFAKKAPSQYLASSFSRGEKKVGAAVVARRASRTMTRNEPLCLGS